MKERVAQPKEREERVVRVVTVKRECCEESEVKEREGTSVAK